MSERTEWPTAERIADLRAQGVVAYSKVSTAAVGAVIVMVVGWSEAAQIMLVLQDVVALLSGTTGASLMTEQFLILRTALRRVAESATVIVCSAALATIVWRFLQTRGLLYFGALSPSLTRLSHLPSPGAVISRILASFILIVIFSSLWIVFVPRIVRAVLTPLASVPVTATMDSNSRFEWIIQWCLQNAGQFGMKVCIVMVLVALATFLGAKFTFLLRHRMTRAAVLHDRGAR